MQHIADEATDMVVVDRIELVPGQDVCQESEHLHVDVLGVIVGLLRCVLRVIERHDAISHAQVALLLGLILKLDHLLGHFCLEVEQFALILVKDVRVGGVECLGDVLRTGLDRDVFHHDV